MATEKTRLIQNTFERRPNSLINSGKSKECIVVIQRRVSTLDENKNYYGLTMEELLPYQNDPLWQNVRRAILILFWAGLILLLTLSCLIAIVERTQEKCLVNSTKPLHAAASFVTSIPILTLDNRNTILSL